MAFIPDFEYDIFISYAHVDNLTAASDEIGWVELFHKYLEIELWQRVGKAEGVKIWRDHSLDGSQFFDETIQDKLNSSFLFLALTSPGYFGSDYCQKELKYFYERAESDSIGIKIGDRSRIFNVLLRNIPHEEWPPEYGKTSGFSFHEAENSDQLGEPLEPTSDLFRVQLKKLKESICNALDEYKDKVETGKIDEIIKKDDLKENSFQIFFADVADSLKNVCKRTINELRQKEFQVVCGIPPPYEAVSHEERVVKEIKNTQLSIHLLDELSGREIEGDPSKGYPQKQVELGIKYADSQLIWAPKKLNTENIEDDLYKDFLNQLELGGRGESNYDFMRGNQATISQEILEKIDQIKAKINDKKTFTKSSVLVDTHLKDQLYGLKLCHELLDKNIQPFLNQQEDDPRKNIDIFENQLRKVNTIIIVFGQVTRVTFANLLML